MSREMNTILGNAKNIISSDSALSENVMLKAIMENAEMKVGQQGSITDMLNDFRQQISAINAYLSNPKLDAVIAEIDNRIASDESDPDTVVNNMYDEFDVDTAIDGIEHAEDGACKEPGICAYLKQANDIAHSKRMPNFMMLPSMAEALSKYEDMYGSVKECMDTIRAYIRNNSEKLVVLESAYHLDRTANGFYRDVAKKLKGYLVRGQYNPDIMVLEMKDMSKLPVVSGMINALRGIRQERNPQFDLGTGNADIQVYNYVGPAIIENRSVTIFADDSFIHITPEVVDENNFKLNIDKTDGITVAEYKPEYIFDNKKEFFCLAKAFEGLGFSLNTRGASAQFRNINIDLRINEKSSVDLCMNGNIISNPATFDYMSLLLGESIQQRNNASMVFKSINSIYNVEFVKFVVNEARNAKAMIVNIANDYYVYDYVSESKRDIYKLDGYKLCTFIKEKFGYDISGIYGIQINDVNAKITGIEKMKGEIMESITKLENSKTDVLNALKLDIREADRKTLEELIEKVDKQIVNLNNNYILLEDEKTTMTETTPKSVKVGDTVTSKDGDTSGKVIATKGTKSLVNTDDSKTKLADSKTLEKDEKPEGSAPEK